MPLYKRILFAAFLLISTSLFAQQTGETDIHLRRCVTMEAVNKMIAADPGLPEQWRKQGEAQYQRYLQKGSAAVTARTSGGSPYRTLGNEIVIPVVVHIVLPNPALVTDRDVQEQIEILNRDFAGLNTDSTALPPEFLARFGHSRIRFALARKTATGALTSGIERTVSDNQYTEDNYNNVKHAGATGGVNAWDVTRYYNIWITRFSDGILGVSTFPYMTPANEQGTVVNYRAFGNNMSYVTPSFNLGRTLVHETGHFFYLYHIWGDDNGGCNGNDFSLQSGYPLSCTDDTPNQGNSSSSYLGGYITDGCSNSLPGINYQNYMDYSNDISYGMFTQGQVCRMESAATLYRSVLASSDADIPPAGTLDACLSSVSPGSRSGGVTLAVCSGTAVTALLRNLGSDNLTSTVFSIQYDAGVINNINWSGSLAPGADITVNLGNITAATGSHSLKIYVTTPNGGTDMYTANDTITRQIYVTGNAMNMPYSQSFESATFPAEGWYIANPDNGTTWLRSTAAAYAGSASARISNYNGNSAAGQWDDLVSPPLHFNAGADSAKLSFRVAYRAINNTTGSYSDGLEVWVSRGCGTEFTPVYRKSPPNLSTVSTGAASSFTPAITQWRKDSIDLSPYMHSGDNMIVLFRNINGGGNNIYLDDIQFTETQRLNADAATDAVAVPLFNCSTNSISPVVTIRNNARLPLTTVNIFYKIDEGSIGQTTWTGNLATNVTTTVNLPVLNAATGGHHLTVWTSMPNLVADEKTANDTLRVSFTIFGTVQAPLKESFEQTTFPPSGWGIDDQDKAVVWRRVRKATSLTQTNDTAAIVISNYGNTADNVSKDFITPVIQYNNVDSVYLSFDVAAAYNTSLSSFDGLEVLVSTNCGAGTQSAYFKEGFALRTVISSGTEAFVPATASQYRRDSVNITNMLPAGSGSFQLIFRNRSNGRNNIYLDNINVTTRVLPAALKETGYLVYPNPTGGTFTVQHYLAPTTLTGIYVTDMAGRVIFRESYLAGQAPAYRNIDISRFSKGMYLVRLVYTDKAVTEKIIRY